MSQTINEIPKTFEAMPEDIKQCLIKVSKQQIIDLRIRNKKFVVVKFGEELYLYTGKAISEIKEIFGQHKCAKCANFFNEKTQMLCPKVADLSIETCSRFEPTILEAVLASTRIEKYPFVECGIEKFGGAREFLVVSECSRFAEDKKAAERKEEEERRSNERIESLKNSLLETTDFRYLPRKSW